MTEKILENPDQLEPGPSQISKPGTGPDQDQQNLEPGGPWIPALTVSVYKVLISNFELIF